VNSTIIAVFVIVLIAIAALWAKRWIEDRQHKENDDKIQLFNCSITSEGKESGVPNSADVYDCVEADEDTGTSDQKA
jgi:hypothetical protein